MNPQSHQNRPLTVVGFPTVVVMNNYAGEDISSLNSALANLIRSLEGANRSGKEKTATQGGYHSNDEFINGNEPAVMTLRNSILVPAVQHYMSEYYRLMFAPDRSVTAEQLLFKGWANIMRKGEWNAPHDHITPHNRISLVYYVSLPECKAPEGALQFDNPNSISSQHGAHGNIKFQPKEGDLIMFPSYQKHFSHPFSEGKERILVACDVRVKDRFDENRANNINSLLTYTR